MRTLTWGCPVNESWNRGGPGCVTGASLVEPELFFRGSTIEEICTGPSTAVYVRTVSCVEVEKSRCRIQGDPHSVQGTASRGRRSINGPSRRNATSLSITHRQRSCADTYQARIQVHEKRNGPRPKETAGFTPIPNQPVELGQGPKHQVGRG